MQILSQFTIYLTLLLIFFIVILLAMEGFCAVVKRVARKRDVSSKLMKYVEVLDWLKEEDDE